MPDDTLTRRTPPGGGVPLWLAACFVLAVWNPAAEAQDANMLHWESLSAPQDADAGSFYGVSNGVVIVAGGAGGDRITAYDFDKNRWIVADATLPRPLADGASVSFDDQVVCIGGTDGISSHAQVTGLRWDAGRIEVTALPPLPTPQTGHATAVVGNVLYVAGGRAGTDQKGETAFWGMDLLMPSDQMAWVKLPAMPGPNRDAATAAALGDDFYLVGGVRSVADPDTDSPKVLHDGYRYSPDATGDWTQGAWERIADIPGVPIPSSSPVPALGLVHFALLANVSDENPTPAQTERGSPIQNTPEVLGYHPGSDTWVRLGRVPGPGASPLLDDVRNGKLWVLPGADSTRILASTTPAVFGWVNWVTLGAYLLIIIVIGLYFAKSENTTQDFFLAGRRIPWWAAGISIFGTTLSGITFIAIPAEAYVGNWAVAIGSLLIFLMTPLFIYCYLPFYRRLNITSAYEYLELRFNLPARLFGGITFILFQVSRMGVVLFIPAIALSSVTGMNLYLCITMMGVICIVYTVIGGMAAVIWTDVLQVGVLFGGAALCMVYILIGVPDGPLEAIHVAYEADKLRVFDWDWSPGRPVVWVMVVGFFFLNLTPYTTDQSVIQRYLTTPTEKQAARSLWLNAWLILPSIPIFMGLGTALWLFCLRNPGSITPDTSSEVLPWFIAHQLPAGIAGVVIAGVFAATMSSVDSAINSISAVCVSDFYKRFRPSGTERSHVLLAKIIVVGFGVIGTGSALLLAAIDIGSIFETFQVFLGLLGGSITGVFILGIFTRRTNGLGILVGAVVGSVTPLITQMFTDVSPYLYGAIGVTTCVASGYAASLMMPRTSKDLAGLTYATLNPPRVVEHESKETVQ